MKIDYTGRHMEVTPALKSHVEEQFHRIELFTGDGMKAHVILEKDGAKHRSEVIVNWRNEVLTAATSLGDMYQSLTKTIDKIEKQARRLKSKIIDKKHRSEKVSKIVTGIDDDLGSEPSHPRIVTSRRYTVKPMSVEEAALILKDEKNQFLVFRNSENEKVAVIYRRENGDYGLIQP